MTTSSVLQIAREQLDAPADEVAPAPGRPLRVCHLIKSLGRGGAETLLVTTLRASDPSRARYDYVHLMPWKDALVEELRAEGAEVRCLANGSLPGMLPAMLRVAQYLRRTRPDVLHCHLPVAGVVGRIAGVLASVPVVYTEHNRLERYNTVTRRLHLATWSLQRVAVAVSDSVRDSIEKHAGARARVRVVQNGVDTTHFATTISTAEARRLLGLPKGPVVGTVAVFREAKRLDHWLQAAASIRERMPDAQFLVVGDGPLRAQVAELTRTHGLEECVHLPGLHADVRPYLAAMDVFAMSSSVEGLPVAMLEAMSMERPVVATSVGGIPEAIRHEENGILVQPGNVASLATSILRVLESPALASRLGLRARETVVERFSVVEMARQLELIYTDVAGGR